MISTLDKYTCEQVFRRLDDYLDRELTADEMRQVGTHLETCATCAMEHRFQEGVIHQVRSRLQRVSAPPDLLLRVSGVLRQNKG